MLPLLTPRQLPPANIRLDVQARTADELFALVSDLAQPRAPAVAQRAHQRLARRHARRSVAIGRGFALPHAAVPGLTATVAVYVRCPGGLELPPPDDRPVTDVLALLVPMPGLGSDFELLTSMTRRLQAAADGERLRASADGAEIRGLLTGTLWN